MQFELILYCTFRFGGFFKYFTIIYIGHIVYCIFRISDIVLRNSFFTNIFKLISLSKYVQITVHSGAMLKEQTER